MSEVILEELKQQSVHLLDASITKIQHCLSQLDEQQVWFRPEQSMNSIGNLLLHQSGNLRQWVVCGVGGELDERDRPAEFSADHSMVKHDLLSRVQETVENAKRVIGSVAPDAAMKVLQIQGFSVTSLGAIMHSVPHFVGHSHQVIYLTRLQLGKNYQFAWTPDSDRTGVPI